MQYCTACHKAIASVFMMDLSEGSVVGQQHLCPACAESLGVVQPKTHLKLSAEILEDLLGLKGKTAQGKGKRDGGCPGCGMTPAEFKVKGRLGCPRCYEAFRQDLVPLLQRVHEASSHRGRLPGRAPAAEPPPHNRMAELRRKLEDAIRGERYEEAARLRDELRQIEKVPPGEDLA
jgi:protein arginine kinase activator